MPKSGLRRAATVMHPCGTGVRMIDLGLSSKGWELARSPVGAGLGPRVKPKRPLLGVSPGSLTPRQHLSLPSTDLPHVDQGVAWSSLAPQSPTVRSSAMRTCELNRIPQAVSAQRSSVLSASHPLTPTDMLSCLLPDPRRALEHASDLHNPHRLPPRPDLRFRGHRHHRRDSRSRPACRIPRPARLSAGRRRVQDVGSPDRVCAHVPRRRVKSPSVGRQPRHRVAAFRDHQPRGPGAPAGRAGRDPRRHLPPARAPGPRRHRAGPNDQL